MGDDTVTDTDDSPRMTMGAIFDRFCPYYLSIGMTYDMYWNGDVCAAKAFREAHKLKSQRELEQKNTEMWLQGMYFYNALCCVSPVLHAFAKTGTKPSPYMSEPIPITREQDNKIEQKKQQSANAKAKAFMEMFMVSHNKKFKEGGMTNGGNN